MSDDEIELDAIIDESDHPQVTLEDLKTLLRKYPQQNATLRAHLLAIVTTGRLMGDKWCQKWAWEFNSKNKVGMYFQPTADPDDQHVVWRQIRFAELLFDCQKLRGFATRLKDWRGSEPESIVAELESAYYLRSCGHRASFVSTSPQGEKTPDFEVTLRFGLKCAWEAKARIETLAFNEKQLTSVLQNARKQLPGDINNIIFVRIPEKWSLEYDFETRIQSPVDQLFRNSQRSISVLFHWELWEPDERLGVGGLEFPNLRWDIVTGKRRVMETYRGFPPRWVHFDRV